MDMNIQYKSMNPYEQLPNAVATGLGLGLQAKKLKMQEGDKAPNLTIPDPGQRQQVDPKSLLNQEMSDIARWKEYQQKAKGLPEPEQDALWEAMKMKGIFKSPIVVNSIGIKDVDPKEYESAIKKVITNDPTAEFDLQILKGKLGKDSAGAKAIDEKIAQGRQEQQKMDADYDLKLKNTLNFVLDFQNDPRKYSNKGITPEQVQKMVNASGDQLIELAKNPANKDWISKYLSAQAEIRARGGGASKGYQPQYDEYGRAMTFNKDLGRYEYAIDPKTGEPYRMNVPASQADVIGAAIGGNLGNLGKKTNPEPPPRNTGKNPPVANTQGKVATEAIMKEYIKKYGKDKALEKLKADGYK